MSNNCVDLPCSDRCIRFMTLRKDVEVPATSWKCPRSACRGDYSDNQFIQLVIQENWHSGRGSEESGILQYYNESASGRDPVERPTLMDTPRVRVIIPDNPVQEVRGEFNSPAARRPISGPPAKTAKPQGLSPWYFTWA